MHKYVAIDIPCYWTTISKLDIILFPGEAQKLLGKLFLQFWDYFQFFRYWLRSTSAHHTCEKPKTAFGVVTYFTSLLSMKPNIFLSLLWSSFFPFFFINFPLVPNSVNHLPNWKKRWKITFFSWPNTFQVFC